MGGGELTSNNPTDMNYDGFILHNPFLRKIIADDSALGKVVQDVVGALALTDGKQPIVAEMVDHFEGGSSLNSANNTPHKNANKKKPRVSGEETNDVTNNATSATSFEEDRRAQ
jgi:hypothetical protein